MNVAEKKHRVIEPDSLIGKRIPKMDAPDKASGRTRYIHDINLPGQLHGKILRSARIHALIKSIDTSAARALPGVHVVITAADIADQRPIGVAKDHFPLKVGRVRSQRDEIAAVAAESEEIAEAALKLIKVEYEDLPVIGNPEDSIKPGAVLIHPEPHGADGTHLHLKQGTSIAHKGKPDNVAMRFDYTHGDVVHGEAESDVVIEDTFKLHYVTHCCMGVSGMIAEFDAGGNVLMYSNTQVPFLHKREFAEYLNIDPARIRSRKDGTLTFRQVHTLHDNGAYTSWGATTPFVMMQTFSSLYRVPHCDYHTAAVYTNNPYAGSFRGYGNLQATFAIEQHMDMLAETIGMDPLEFRMKNAQEAGEVTGQGMSFKSCGFKDCIKTAAGRSDFSRKFAENHANQKKPGNIKRGIGMASMLHVGGGAKIYPSDGCGTILKLDDFANVTLITGASEIGQGSETVLSQLVCEELGLPISAVTVVNNDTAITPWDVGVHASRTTFVAGNSAIGAARKAKSKILAVAAKKFDCTEADLDLRGGFVIRADSGEALVELSKLLRNLHFQDKAELVMTTFYYEPPSVHQDKGFKGDVSAAYAWGTQVVEVEVDTDTGFIKLLKVTGAHDVGRVLNRLGIEGQIEGGVVMGQGYAFTEDLMIEDGKMKNPNFRDYKLVTAPEIPEMDIAFIESMDGEGPQGAKGVGEAPAICMAAAAANAIANATGTRLFELPFTPEKVYRALHGQAPKRYWKPWKAE
ncbi:MAG: xanthine dehydrogenase family protein [Rhodocyclales bacterium]|nr:xanthine dehydrogenase family protein [Rhodocyclales bacterium]